MVAERLRSSRDPADRVNEEEEDTPLREHFHWITRIQLDDTTFYISRLSANLFV